MSLINLGTRCENSVLTRWISWSHHCFRQRGRAQVLRGGRRVVLGLVGEERLGSPGSERRRRGAGRRDSRRWGMEGPVTLEYVDFIKNRFDALVSVLHPPRLRMLQHLLNLPIVCRMLRTKQTMVRPRRPFDHNSYAVDVQRFLLATSVFYVVDLLVSRLIVSEDGLDQSFVGSVEGSTNGLVARWKELKVEALFCGED
jgi:hypothetical protein